MKTDALGIGVATGSVTTLALLWSMFADPDGKTWDAIEHVLGMDKPNVITIHTDDDYIVCRKTDLDLDFDTVVDVDGQRYVCDSPNLLSIDN